MTAEPCLSSIPCTQLVGVGKKVAEKLAGLGIQSIQDILFHLPRSYQDRTTIVPLNRVRPGLQQLVQGDIVSAQVVFGRRRSLVVNLSDGAGVLTLRFFHFNRAMKSQLSENGGTLRCFGEIRFGARGLEIVHPEYQRVDGQGARPPSEALTPIYPLTEGLGQATLRSLVAKALAHFAGKGALQEYLPAFIHQQYGFVSLEEALRFVHHPPVDVNTEALINGNHPAVKRLAFEELLAHQLVMIESRQSFRRHQAHALEPDRKLREQLMQGLGFELTEAQQRVIKEIDRDLGQSQPMMRLVQGDVGCGKTVVAAMVMCRALAAGKQVALMAPTEVLAEQHFKTFSHWFERANIKVLLLVGRLGAKARREVLHAMAEQVPLVVIGTHALFQEEVVFADLSLVVIDEQHRFGVGQRQALIQKGAAKGAMPHQLIMTATPIPRTMAMTAYADLDYSIIDALPKGRKPIQTVVLANNRRDDVIERVLANHQGGGQAYWVCTLIDESEALQCQAAEATAEMLAKRLPGMKVGLVHGKMSSEEKDAVMQQFKNQQIALLVATTVIEVGVDVPNANLMIIENAERLGLAQLHQLRGRVGRGSAASYCVLLYQPPLSNRGQDRLHLLRSTHDGFVIAEKDLQWRGSGEMLGTRQTGLPQYRIADVLRDQGLLSDVQKVAKWLMQNAPEAVSALQRRWVNAKQASYMRS